MLLKSEIIVRIYSAKRWYSQIQQNLCKLKLRLYQKHFQTFIVTWAKFLKTTPEIGAPHSGVIKTHTIRFKQCYLHDMEHFENRCNKTFMPVNMFLISWLISSSSVNRLLIMCPRYLYSDILDIIFISLKQQKCTCDNSVTPFRSVFMFIAILYFFLHCVSFLILLLCSMGLKWIHLFIFSHKVWTSNMSCTQRLNKRVKFGLDIQHNKWTPNALLIFLKNGVSNPHTKKTGYILDTSFPSSGSWDWKWISDTDKFNIRLKWNIDLSFVYA